MKRIFHLLLLLITLPEGIMAQQKEQVPTTMFRLYEDNDFINLRGKGTDRAYTNGTRLELFFQKDKSSNFIIDRLLPKAGDRSINVFGWGLAQIMTTPSDISRRENQPDDYPYTGSLFATHSLYASNPVKKFGVQTELVAGVRGPSALARQTQTIIHQLTGNIKPMGWDNQLPDKLILNINIGAEKQIAGAGNWLEIIAGGYVSAGTFVTGAGISPTIRIGKMNPYFNGLIQQFASAKSERKNKIQLYGIIKPGLYLNAGNSLLEESRTGKPLPQQNEAEHDISRVIYFFNGGLVCSINRFSLSVT